MNEFVGKWRLTEMEAWALQKRIWMLLIPECLN